MQTSCVNPDGSAATSDGWSSTSAGTPPDSSVLDDTCGPGHPMSAVLSDLSPASPDSAEILKYTAPSGSTLIGGSMSVALTADGHGTGATGTATLYEPNYAYDASDVFFNCAWGETACNGSGGYDFSGTVTLPAGRGGNILAGAGCGGGGSCTTGGPDGSYSSVRIAGARLLLSDAAQPTAGPTFTGTAAQPVVSGVGHLLFTASDDGPGVYQVSAALDGHTVETIVPDGNDGACAPIGTDPATGALEFDHGQPCPTSVGVDLPVPTGGLPDGHHELTVTVTDAGRNSVVVEDSIITTSNPQLTPVRAGRQAIHTRFVISWSWSGATTVLRVIAAHHLPADATLRFACRGPRCPRLRVSAAHGARIGRLLRSLAGRRFAAGDRLLLAVTAPHRMRERVALSIRRGRQPVAALLRR